jgi:rhodanese-related sulfurtransferase
MGIAQAHEEYQAGALFLDVRSQAEWNQGHIAKSLLIPLDDLPSQLDELPRDRDIVVVCRSGARSKEGAMILRQAGFSRVTCMTGGIQAWVAAGYPVEQ